jgi:hypothetical protein
MRLWPTPSGANPTQDEDDESRNQASDHPVREIRSHWVRRLRTINERFLRLLKRALIWY